MKKNKKLFAILTLVAFMMTLVPALAFAKGTAVSIDVAIGTDAGKISFTANADAANDQVSVYELNADGNIPANAQAIETITVATAGTAVAGTQKIAAPAVGTKYGVKVGVLTTNDVTTPEATVEYDQDLADAVQEAIDLQVATDVIGVKDFAVVGGAGNVITSAAVSGYTVTIDSMDTVLENAIAKATGETKAVAEAVSGNVTFKFVNGLLSGTKTVKVTVNPAAAPVPATVADAKAALDGKTINITAGATTAAFPTKILKTVTVGNVTSGVTLSVFDYTGAAMANAAVTDDGTNYTGLSFAGGANTATDTVTLKITDGTTTAYATITIIIAGGSVSGAADVTTSSFGAQYANGGNPNVDAKFAMYALFLDSSRNDVSNANQPIYVWAEDVTNPGTPSTAFVVDTVAGAASRVSNGTGFSASNALSASESVYKLSAVNNDEKIMGHFTRSGEYNIYAAFTTGSGDTEKAAVNNTTKMQLGNSKIVVNENAGDPKANYSATINGTVLSDGDTYESISVEPNNVAYKNTIVTLKNKGNRLVGKTVKIETNSANIQVNKETAVTNSLGQIDFDLSASREGTYYVYLSCDGFEVKVKVIVGNTNATYIAVSDQPNAPVALYGDKDDLDIRVDLTDVNGNTVTGTNPGGATKAYTSSSDSANYKYVAFTSKPAGTVLKDSDLAIAYDNTDKNYQLTMNGKTFDKEGTYEVKIVLDNGNYVTVSFEVKQFTTPVSIQLDYKQSSIELNGTSNAPSVKYVDANGTKQNAKNKVTLAATGYAIASFDTSNSNTMGVIKVKNDEKYIGQTITVTAVDSRYNLTASQTLTVADEAQNIKFDSTKAQVNVNNKIDFHVTDANGNTVALGNNATVKDISFVITSKPEGAKVSAVTSGNAEKDLLSYGKATMALTSDKEGEVTVQVLVSVEAVSSNSTTGLVNKYYTGTETFKVTKEIGKGSAVVMTIGSATMVVNDTTVAIDAPAMIKDNRTFVPVRALMEAFGATVDFDEATNVVNIKADGKTISLTLGSSVMTVGDKAVTMDVAAFATNEGRTMVPVRAIAEAAGYAVEATYNADGTTASVVFTK